jgi:hypothetical protein
VRNDGTAHVRRRLVLAEQRPLRDLVARHEGGAVPRRRRDALVVAGDPLPRGSEG